MSSTRPPTNSDFFEFTVKEPFGRKSFLNSTLTLSSFMNIGPGLKTKNPNDLLLKRIPLVHAFKQSYKFPLIK